MTPRMIDNHMPKKNTQHFPMHSKQTTEREKPIRFGSSYRSLLDNSQSIATTC